MRTSISLSRSVSAGNYFALLAAARPVAAVIAQQLEPLAPSGAKALRCCGRYGIGSAPIELVEGAHGLFARGVKWCGSRFCPICQPRMMAVLGCQRATRTRMAEAAGFGIAFARFSQPRGVPGELFALMDAQRDDWKLWPAPSRLPKSWTLAGLESFLGFDYNTEIDWDAVAEDWHLHTHALPFARTAFSSDALAFLRSWWPHGDELAWAEEVECPEAAARYSVKAENNKPELLSLFDLARLGMVEQVSEYLHAVQGRRLRASSVALSKALGLGPAVEDDAALLARADASAGRTVERFTVDEWRRCW